MHGLARLSATVGLALLTAGCGGSGTAQDAPLTVDGTTVRLNANPAAPSAAYFTVHGGSTAMNLVEITSPDAERVEMHEMRMENGLMRMATLAQAPVPAKGTLVFAPGGNHAMLWGIRQPAIAAGKIHLVFHFTDGRQVEADAPVQRPGEVPAMGAMNMSAGNHEGH